MKQCGPAQCHTETQGVGEVLGQCQGCVHPGHRLVGVAEEPEGERRLHMTTHSRVVPTVERRMGAVPLWIVELSTLFEMRPGRGRLIARQYGSPQRVVGLEQ